MEKAGNHKKESFKVIISSGTDVRKQPRLFNITKKTFVIFFTAVFVFAAAILTTGILLLVKSTQNAIKLNVLEQQAKEQNSRIETYTQNLKDLQQSAQQKATPE